MEKHYVCTGGCRGESKTPGVCQTEGCPKKGQPLTDCGCEDWKHEELLGKAEEKKQEGEE